MKKYYNRKFETIKNTSKQDLTEHLKEGQIARIIGEGAFKGATVIKTSLGTLVILTGFHRPGFILTDTYKCEPLGEDETLELV